LAPALLYQVVARPRRGRLERTIDYYTGTMNS
jgi:hypothetical protein